jgi:hypothetical protein
MLTQTARKWAVTGALALGAAVGAAGVANAASGGSSGSSGSGGQPPAAVNPARVAHGPGETLLTGSAATKAKSAALAAVPGATVIRVETDSGPAAYEAHLRTSDGSYVTVKLDKSFHVTATQSGFGAGGPGGPPPGGAPPSGSPQ